VIGKGSGGEGGVRDLVVNCRHAADSMQLDLGSVCIAPHADCLLVLLHWSILADIMQERWQMLE
jgi:hypothetical protein